MYQHFAFFFFVSRRSRSRQTFSQFCSFFLVFGLVQLSRHKMTTAVSKKRAKDIKKKYTKDDDRFAPFFSTNICYFGLKIDECSEGFTAADLDKLLGLACELELDRCEGFSDDDTNTLYKCAPVHAINALLLLVASDRSIADTVAQRMAPRCANTIDGEDGTEFITEITGPNLVVLMDEIGPIAVPYLVAEMHNLLFAPDLSTDSWLGTTNVGAALNDIIRESQKDIPLAISLTQQFCAPLLEFLRQFGPTLPATARANSSVNMMHRSNAGYFLKKVVDIAMLITEEKEVLQLCRLMCGLESTFDHSWLDVLRSFSLEPHPQDELLRVRGNRLDWVIQIWNENHPDKQFPFPRGVVDGPFPGQPGYELPKRLFRHKYCRNPYKCVNESAGSSHTPVGIKVCDRCKHTYYCSDICQREGWYCRRNGEADQFPRDSFPSKFLVRPLKRLLPESRSWLLSHRHQCLLIQAYKRWVKIQKQERSAGVNEDEEQATAADEG